MTKCVLSPTDTALLYLYLGGCSAYLAARHIGDLSTATSFYDSIVGREKHRNPLRKKINNGYLRRRSRNRAVYTTLLLENNDVGFDYFLHTILSNGYVAILLERKLAEISIYKGKRQINLTSEGVKAAKSLMRFLKL